MQMRQSNYPLHDFAALRSVTDGEYERRSDWLTKRILAASRNLCTLRDNQFVSEQQRGEQGCPEPWHRVGVEVEYCTLGIRSALSSRDGCDAGSIHQALFSVVLPLDDIVLRNLRLFQKRPIRVEQTSGCGLNGYSESPWMLDVLDSRHSHVTGMQQNPRPPTTPKQRFDSFHTTFVYV
ncbi:uncharacterized protein V6R79_006097 [Siganus canaliculatus]